MLVWMVMMVVVMLMIIVRLFGGINGVGNPQLTQLLPLVHLTEESMMHEKINHSCCPLCVAGQMRAVESDSSVSCSCPFQRNLHQLFHHHESPLL